MDDYDRDDRKKGEEKREEPDQLNVLTQPLNGKRKSLPAR
jgi:hypothetical protein